MSAGKLLRFFVAFLLVDLGCIAIGKPPGWLHSLGERGLAIDFLLLLVIVGFYIFRES